MNAVSILAFLGNHLWQSTIFAAVVAVLALVLRENRAQARYWLWVAASMKFLIPLSLLVGITGHFARTTPASTVLPPAAFDRLEQWSEPFVRRDAAIVVSSISATGSKWPLVWPRLLLAVWLSGCVIVAIASFRSWRHVATWARQATPLLEGPQARDLQRLQQLHGLSKPIPIALSESALEPGLFGIIRPVLLLPADIGSHLDKEQLGAILAHEMSHARRRDNLWAVLHMIVEAAFWFHPLVWWLGSRLVDERERSCDEDVLGRGCEPEVYARAIVKICHSAWLHP